jgi:hypothetical protein
MEPSYSYTYIHNCTCILCNRILNINEYDYNIKYREKYGQSLSYIFFKKDGYICSIHWCTCIPESDPCNYLAKCNTELCNNYYCEYCVYKDYDTYNYYCKDCYSNILCRY